MAVTGPVHIAEPAIPTREKSYDATYKLEVMEYAATNSNREADRKFHVGGREQREGLEKSRSRNINAETKIFVLA